MKQIVCLGFLLTLIFSPFNSIKIAEAENTCSEIAGSTIFISEIAWAGSSQSAADEWLELTNNTQETVDLSNWIIEGAATGGGKITLPETSQISPNGGYLIANYSAENFNSILNSPPNYVTASLSLSNSGLSLTLKKSDGCLVDQAGDGGAPFFGGTSTTGTVSMIRFYSALDGTVQTSWIAAESSKGFDSGAPDLGTPGTIDTKAIEATEATPLDRARSPEAGEEGETTEVVEVMEVTGTSEVTTALAEAITNQETDEPANEPSPPKTNQDEVNNSAVEKTETENKVTTEVVSKFPIDEPITETAASEFATTEINQLEETDGGSSLSTNEIKESVSSEESISNEVIENNGETAPIAEQTMINESFESTSGISNNPSSKTASEQGKTIDSNEVTGAAGTSTETASEDEKITERSNSKNSVYKTTPISYSKGTLVINEFVSDPISGEKEWVEILNPYNTTIPLIGWKISEASGRKISLSDISLGLEQTSVAEFSSGALNNNGDTIILLDPNDNIIDQIQYGTEEIPAADDPNSVVRKNDGSYVITTVPTKGASNVVTMEIRPPPQPSPVVTTGEGDPFPSEIDDGSSASPTQTTTHSSNGEKGGASTANTEEVDSENKNLTAGSTTNLSLLRLSELYPNTDGSDETEEFIEVENFGVETINLLGIKFEDAAGNSWTAPNQIEIAPQTFLAISRNKFQFALNNSGSEIVRLYAADGNLLDEIQYENAPKKFSFARDDSAWRWNDQPSPNEPNAFSETVGSENSGVAESGGITIALERNDETKSFTRLSLMEARAVGNDNWVLVEGIVSVKPGTLGSQIFYLSDGESGIQIYKSDGNFPDLEIGDRLELSGTTSSNRDEPRIKIGKNDTVTILEENLPLSILDISLVDEKSAGLLARLTGIITEKSANQFTMENEAGLSEIKIKDGSDIGLTDLKPGTKIAVTGLVGQTEKNFYLLPRSPEDIILNQVSTAVIAATNEPTGKTIAAGRDQRRAIIIGGLVILAAAGYALRQKLKTKKTYEKDRKLSLVPTG